LPTIGLLREEISSFMVFMYIMKKIAHPKDFLYRKDVMYHDLKAKIRGKGPCKLIPRNVIGYGRRRVGCVHQLLAGMSLSCFTLTII
jgi:hypothetical protein